MHRKNMENGIKCYKGVASKPLFWFLIGTQLACIAFFVILFFLPTDGASVYYVLIGIILIGLPLLAMFLCMRRFLSVIEINDEGVSRVAFKKFYKLSIKWGELKEVRYFESILPFLMFSKTQSLCGLSYDQMIKIKDCIQIQLNRKNYKVIKRYFDKQISGLTSEKIKALKLEK